jgi:hypothetical protein
VTCEALGLLVTTGQQVEQQAERRARPGRPAVHPVQVVRHEQRLHVVRLEVPVEEFPQAAGEEPDQLAELAAGGPPEATADPGQLSERAEPPSAQVGRGLEEEGLEVPGQPLQPGVEVDEGPGVGRRQPLDLGGGPTGLGPPREDLAARPT